VTTPTVVLTSTEDLDVIFRELPPPGARIRANFAIERSGLSTHRGWGALAMLCTERRAKVWDDEGYTWAARAPEEGSRR